MLMAWYWTYHQIRHLIDHQRGRSGHRFQQKGIRTCSLMPASPGRRILTQDSPLAQTGFADYLAWIRSRSTITTTFTGSDFVPSSL